MNLKSELVLILSIWWHFRVYKMLFSVFSLDSFPTFLEAQQCARNSTRCSRCQWIKRGKPLTLCSLHFSECIWSSEPPKEEPADAPMNPLDLGPESDLGPVSFLPWDAFATYLLLLNNLRPQCIQIFVIWEVLGSWMPTGDDEVVAVCCAWVPNKVFAGIWKNAFL